MVLALFMSAAPILLSTSTPAPTGAEAARLSLSDLLVLIIVQLFILWAEGLAASLRDHPETTDLTAVIRLFGTTDPALILHRLTVGLQRCYAREAMILRAAAGPDADPQPITTDAAASPRIPSALPPRGRKPTSVPPLTLLTPKQRVAPPARATGPPRTLSTIRNAPTGPVHPLPPRGMAGPVMPFSLPRAGRVTPKP